jgi:fumarate reductase subunit C
MLDLRLYMAQGLSTLIMAPLVIVHIAVMIYAIQDGLSVDEILGARRGRLHGLPFTGCSSWPCRLAFWCWEGGPFGP